MVLCLTSVERCLRFPRDWPRLTAPFRGVNALAASAALILCATTTADVPAAAARPIPVLRSNPDPRVARLEKFFRRYRCPAPYHVPEYLRAADGYGLDYRLLPAISIRETHCGVQEKDNNRLGYHPGQGGFPSIEAGIDFIGRRIAEHPFYKGKSLQGKLYTYNPRPAYPEEIQWIMRQIK
jgi:hypothetical protein